jgi:hypothetical protein
MSLTKRLRRLRQAHWRGLSELVKRAYLEGYDDGFTRGHGQSRRGRTIREDATVEGLLRQIGQHFGLDRYNFEVRVVHARSKRAVPARDLLSKYKQEE